MENALDEVEAQVTDVPQEIHPYFMDVFEGLGQYLCIKPPDVEESIPLDLLAGRLSKQVLGLGCSPTAYGLFTQIARFTGIDQVSNTLVTIRGVFPVSSLRKMYVISSFRFWS